MTLRRDKFATVYGSRRTLLSTGDFFDWKGHTYIVRSHSRWYCWAVRHYPPNPNLGRILADEWEKLCESNLVSIGEINRRYAKAFKPVRTEFRRGVSYSC